MIYKEAMFTPPEKRRRVVEFHILSSLHDRRPIVVRRECHATRTVSLLVPDSCSELFEDIPSFPEVLWRFYRFEDTKKCLTIMDNPHFYAKLPESLEGYGAGIKIDPTGDLQHADKFYVLTDRPNLVYIMTDQVTLTFGNFWRSDNAVVFKGLSIFVVSLL